MTAQANLAQLQQAIQSHFTDFECITHRNQLTLIIPREQLLETAQILRDHADFQFEQCVDVAGVDYLTYGQAEFDTESASNTGFSRGVEWITPQDTSLENRFAVVYHLLSLEYNRRLRLRVYLETKEPIVNSLTTVWNGVNWFEREVFDLFGILFYGHPDLRRILTDYGFIGHPFRKDFPISGQVQMRYDEKQGRCIYEPVDIEPRVLVPKVIRADNRYIEQPTEDSNE